MTLLAFVAFTITVWLIKRKLLISFLKNPPGIVCDTVVNGLGV